MAKTPTTKVQSPRLNTVIFQRIAFYCNSCCTILNAQYGSLLDYNPSVSGLSALASDNHMRETIINELTLIIV